MRALWTNNNVHLQVRAALWMFGWAFCYALSNVCMKKIDGFPRELIICFRTIIQCGFLAMLLLRNRVLAPTKKQMPWYGLRLCIGYLAMHATYAAYGKLPLPTATAIGFTEPSIAMVLAMFFFGLRVEPKYWLFVLCSYLGVLLINYPIVYANIQWMLVGLCANLLASLGKILSKHLLSYPNVKPTQIIVYGAFFMLPFSAFWAIPSWDIDLLTAQRFYLLLAISLLSLMSQYCYLHALHMTHLDFIAPMTYTKLVFTIPFSYYFFHELPNRYAVLGILIIVWSNYMVIRYKRGSKASASIASFERQLT